jgi:hypothetical protein
MNLFDEKWDGALVARRRVTEEMFCPQCKRSTEHQIDAADGAPARICITCLHIAIYLQGSALGFKPHTRPAAAV